MAYVSPPIIATGDLITAAEWNSNFSYLYDSGWLPFPVYTNSWHSNYGPAAGATVAGYRTIGNRVQLGGTITGGAANTAALTMPVGTRPLANPIIAQAMTTVSSNNWVGILVSTAGVLTPVSYGSGTVPGLESVTWLLG